MKGMREMRRFKFWLFTAIAILTLISIRDKEVVLHVPDNKPLIAEAYQAPTGGLPQPDSSNLSGTSNNNSMRPKPTSNSSPSNNNPNYFDSNINNNNGSDAPTLSNPTTSGSPSPFSNMAPGTNSNSGQQVAASNPVYGFASVLDPSTTNNNPNPDTITGGSGGGVGGGGVTPQTIAPKPVFITNVTPSNSVPGVDVIIQGANFSTTASENTVKFGTVQASAVSVVSPNQIHATVPQGLTPGFTKATVGVGTLTSNAMTFDVLKDTGHNVFVEKAPFGISIQDSSIIRLADIDGDNDLDILIVDKVAGKIHLLINDGSGHFNDEALTRIPVAIVNSASVITDAAFGDMDGDGDIDIVLAYSQGQSVRLLLNTGAGVFPEAPSLSIPDLSVQAAALDLGDVNGDGYLDIIVASHDSKDILLVNNKTGVGFFTKDAQFDLPAVIDGSSDIRFCDINGDGSLDVITTNNEIVGSSSLRNRIYLNNGSGEFTDVTDSVLPADSEYSEVLDIGDLDADGDMDLVVGCYGQNLLFINNGNAFEDRTGDLMPTSPNGFHTNDIKLGDLNGDKYPDLIAVSDTRTVFFINDKNGSFKFVDASIRLPDYASTPAQIGGSNVQLADIDGDGALDIIIGGPSSPPHILTSSADNKGPVLDHIGDKTAEVGKDLTFNIHASDPNGDTITYSYVSAMLPASATLDPSTGVFLWTPGSDDAVTPEKSVLFMATENTQAALQATEPIKITVTGNAPPELTVDPPTDTDVTVNYGESVVFTAYATDPDMPISITWTVNGQVYSGTPDNFSAFSVAFGRGTHTVVVTATDSNGASSSRTWKVKVYDKDNPNHAPVFTSTTPSTPLTLYVPDNQAVSQTFSVTTNDPDNHPNVTQALTLTWEQKNSAGNYVAIPGAGNGASAMLGLGIGRHFIRVTVTDNATLPASSYHEWDVTVSPPTQNHAPTAYDQPATTGKNTSKTITLTANDPDAGDLLTYNIVTTAGHGTLTGTAPNLTYTPATNYVGSDTFTFKANDGKLDSNIATVSITVIEVDHVPFFTSTTPSTPLTLYVPDNQAVSQTFSVTADDLDNHPNITQTLTFVWEQKNSAGNYVAIPGAGTGASAMLGLGLGEHFIRVTVTDNPPPSASASYEWDVTVTPSSQNQAPTANPDTATTNVNTFVDIDVLSNDSDLDGNTISIVGSSITTPAHGTATLSSGKIRYTPATGYTGTDSFTYKVTDGSLQSASALVSITVNSIIIIGPVAVDDTASTNENTPVTINVLANDSNLGTSPAVSIVTGAAHGNTVVNADNTVTYTPASGYSGSDAFVYNVTNAAISSNNATVSITVEQALDDQLIQDGFNFFWNETDNPETGFVRDRVLVDPASRASDPAYNKASMAATGFALAAMCAAYDDQAVRGDVTQEEIKDRVALILTRLLEIQNKQSQDPVKWGKSGFFYHFVNIASVNDKGIEAGERWTEPGFASEVSTIDTAILVAGVLTAGEYFKGIDSDIYSNALQIYSNVNWKAFLDTNTTTQTSNYTVANEFYNQMYQVWLPEAADGGMSGHWNYTSECMLLYMLAAAAPVTDYAIPADAFYLIRKELGKYGVGANPMVKTWFGPLFVYQYTQAFFSFKDASNGSVFYDPQGVAWWDNSVEATKANKRYCNDFIAKFAGQEDLWGLTSGYTSGGNYLQYGAPPTGGPFPSADVLGADGTIFPAAAAGSMPFLPDETLRALAKMKDLYTTYNYPVWGDYGFVSSFKLGASLDQKPSPIAIFYCGIDIGVTLAMAENHKDGLIWNNFSNFEISPNVTIGKKIEDLLGLTTDTSCFITVDDVSAKSNFHMGRIDAINNQYQVKFNLKSVQDAPYLLSVHPFMDTDLPSHTVTVQVSVNNTTPYTVEFTYDPTGKSPDLMRYITIDNNSLIPDHENTITLEWQGANIPDAKWLAWKNIEISSPVENTTWSFARDEAGKKLFGDERRVDDTYFIGADIASFEQAINKDSENFTDILFYATAAPNDYAASVLSALETCKDMDTHVQVFAGGVDTPQVMIFNGPLHTAQQVTTSGYAVQNGWNRITIYHPGLSANDPVKGEWVRWNSVALVAAEPPMLNAPTEFGAASFGNTTVKLRWKAVDHAAKYNIYRAETGGGTYTNRIATVTTPGYTDAAVELQANKIYYYIVKSVKADNSESQNPSAEVSAITGSYRLDYADGHDPDTFGGNTADNGGASLGNNAYTLMAKYNGTTGMVRKIVLAPGEKNTIALNNTNITGATLFSFRIMSDSTNAKIKITLKDSVGGTGVVPLTCPAGFWQNCIFHLNGDFNNVQVSKIDKIEIASDQNPGSVTIYLDEVDFNIGSMSGDNLDVKIRNRLTDALATGLSFGTNASGTKYVTADQYIDIGYQCTGNDWSIILCTNNTAPDAYPKFTGTLPVGKELYNGMIGTQNSGYRIPMVWQVFQTKKYTAPGSLPPWGDFYDTGYVVDKSDWDYWKDQYSLPYRSIFRHSTSSAATYDLDLGFPLDPELENYHRKGVMNQRLYVYLGANFDGAPAQSYATNTLTIDVYHPS